MVLRGSSINLRPIELKDTALIVNWRNKPYVRNNFLWRDEMTPGIHEKWMREQVATGRVVQFIICEKSGRAVGSVYLRDVDRQAGQAEYGIFIGEDNAYGKGYGTEAAKMILEHAFNTLGLQAVFLRVLANNPGAVKSYEKAGFALTGVPDGEAGEINGEQVLFMEIKKP